MPYSQRTEAVLAGTDRFIRDSVYISTLMEDNPGRMECVSLLGFVILFSEHPEWNVSVDKYVKP